jgi:membrane-associated protease RseP (regulator of RpoE activity)
MTTARPDLGFCISGHALDGHIVAVDAEGPARDAGLVDGDVIVSLDGLSLAEFRASDWWPRPQGKPIKVVYHRRGMIHRGNIVVDMFDEPVTAGCAPDAPAAAVRRLGCNGRQRPRATRRPGPSVRRLSSKDDPRTLFGLEAPVRLGLASVLFTSGQSPFLNRRPRW